MLQNFRLIKYKKVLLRERKRHTARHVVGWGGGGSTSGYPFPHPDLARGRYLGVPLPHPDVAEGGGGGRYLGVLLPYPDLAEGGSRYLGVPLPYPDLAWG